MSAKCKVQSAEPRRRSSRFGCLLLYSALCILHSALPALATPTQDDVFKSISSNVDNTMDGRKVFAFFVAATGAVIMIVLLNNRAQKPSVSTPKKRLNHQTKLLRELMKTAGLKSSQVRQLKLLSADLAEKNQPVENLVTLLLCSSLIKKARDTGETRGRKR